MCSCVHSCAHVFGYVQVCLQVMSGRSRPTLYALYVQVGSPADSRACHFCQSWLTILCWDFPISAPLCCCIYREAAKPTNLFMWVIGISTLSLLVVWKGLYWLNHFPSLEAQQFLIFFLEYFYFFFKTKSHCVIILTVLELTLQTRLASNSQISSCLCLPSARIERHRPLPPGKYSHPQSTLFGLEQSILVVFRVEVAPMQVGVCSCTVRS